MANVPYIRQAVTIASGATASSVLDTEGWRVAAIELPSGFTGATLGVRTGDASGTIRKVFLCDATTATELTLTLPAAAATEAVVLQMEKDLTAGRRFLQLVSGSAEAEARAIYVYLVPPVAG